MIFTKNKLLNKLKVNLRPVTSKFGTWWTTNYWEILPRPVIWHTYRKTLLWWIFTLLYTDLVKLHHSAQQYKLKQKLWNSLVLTSCEQINKYLEAWNKYFLIVTFELCYCCSVWLTLPFQPCINLPFPTQTLLQHVPLPWWWACHICWCCHRWQTLGYTQAHICHICWCCDMWQTLGYTQAHICMTDSG